MATLSYVVQLGSMDVDLFGGQQVLVNRDGVNQTMSGALRAADFKMELVAVVVPTQNTPTDAPVTVMLDQLPGYTLEGSAKIEWIADESYKLTNFTGIKLKVPEKSPAHLDFKLKSCSAKLKLDGQPWELTLEPEPPDASGSVATFEILGVTFFLKKLVLDASGVKEADAEVDLKQDPKASGLQNVQVVSATLELAGKQVHAHVQLSFALNYFVGAKGTLDVKASRGDPTANWQVAAVSRINTNATWTDPSGWLSFQDMGIELEVTNAREGNLAITDVRASGKVTFHADALEAKSKEWLGDLFSGLSTEFRNVSLNDASTPAFNFAFSPRGGLSFKAMSFFALKVPSLKFGKDTLTLCAPTLSLDMDSVSLRGLVQDLTISLDGVPSIKGGADNFTIDMALSAPGGVKANGRLKYEHTDTLQRLSGEGQLTTPTFPGVHVMFVLGRFLAEKKWHPTLVIYADTPTNIPLFPGVVVGQLGVALGVNAEVTGTARLTLAQARKRLESGLPDVSRPESWTAKIGTDLTLLARALVSPGDPNHKDPELYAADLTIIVTSDFQMAVMGKLWLLTSLDQAQSAAFQAKPSALGMMLLDGQAPSLRMVAQTRSDGLTGVGGDGVVGKLLGKGLPETRFAMEATPTGLAVVMGPNPIAGDLGRLQVTGSSLLAFRSTPNFTYAIARSSLEARFSTAARMDFSLVNISASLRFGFSSELVLLGYFTEREKDKGKSLTLYGRNHVVAYVELNLHIRIGFRIRIGLPFGRSITISWHDDWDFNWQIHVDLDIELAVSSEGSVGMVGRAHVSINVVGVSATLQVPVDVNTPLIVSGRGLENEIRTDLSKLLEATA